MSRLKSGYSRCSARYEETTEEGESSKQRAKETKKLERWCFGMYADMLPRNRKLDNS